MVKKKWLTVVSLLVALVCIIAACSPPATDSTGTDNSTNANANGDGNQAGSSDEILFAHLGGFTGDYAPYTEPEFKAAAMAVNEINAAGGVVGKNLKFLSEDNHSTVEGAINGFRKLVNINKVTAIIGVESDGILALLQDAKENQVPIIGQSAGTPELDEKGGDYVFRVAPSDSLNGQVAAQVLIEQGYNEIAILVENVEGAQTNAESFEASFEEKGGKVLTVLTYNPGQSTYQGELRRLSESNPKLVYYFGGISSGTTILKEAYQRNYEWEWFVSTEIISPDLINAVGAEVAEGFMGVVAAQDVESPAYKRFAENYKTETGNDLSAGLYQPNAYDAIVLMALAMEAGGEATGKAINDNLFKIANPPGTKVSTFEEGVAELKKGNDIDYEGASGSLNFNDFGNIPSSFAVLKSVGGKFDQIDFFSSNQIEFE